MSFNKAYITHSGLALCAKLIKNDDLRISEVLGGCGITSNTDYADFSQLITPSIVFETNRGIIIDPDHPNQITIPIYYENQALDQAINLSEIGLFAEDPDEGNILFAILPAYEQPLPLPAQNEGKLELSMDVVLELSLAENVQVVLPPSMIFLTKPEAISLFAPIIHRHDAHEIDESNGNSVESWQRLQDAEIEALKLKTDAGTTSADTHQVPTDPMSNYKILNHWGIYDDKRHIFYA